LRLDRLVPEATAPALPAYDLVLMEKEILKKDSAYLAKERK
jgi:hypothetical protein